MKTEDTSHMHLTVIDVPAGEQVIAEDNEVRSYSASGFRVVATYLALGEITIRPPSTKPDARPYERDELVREGPVRRFLMVRDPESAVGAANKRAEEAEARAGRATCEAHEAKKELTLAQGTANLHADAREERDALRTKADKLEMHLAYVRKAIGSERFAEIVDRAESESIPF